MPKLSPGAAQSILLGASAQTPQAPLRESQPYQFSVIPASLKVAAKGKPDTPAPPATTRDRSNDPMSPRAMKLFRSVMMAVDARALAQEIRDGSKSISPDLFYMNYMVLVHRVWLQVLDKHGAAPVRVPKTQHPSLLLHTARAILKNGEDVRATYLAISEPPATTPPEWTTEQHRGLAIIENTHRTKGGLPSSARGLMKVAWEMFAGKGSRMAQVGGVLLSLHTLAMIGYAMRATNYIFFETGPMTLFAVVAGTARAAASFVGSTVVHLWSGTATWGNIFGAMGNALGLASLDWMAWGGIGVFLVELFLRKRFMVAKKGMMSGLGSFTSMAIMGMGMAFQVLVGSAKWLYDWLTSGSDPPPDKNEKQDTKPQDSKPKEPKSSQQGCDNVCENLDKIQSRLGQLESELGQVKGELGQVKGELGQQQTQIDALNTMMAQVPKVMELLTAAQNAGAPALAADAYQKAEIFVHALQGKYKGFTYVLQDALENAMNQDGMSSGRGHQLRLLGPTVAGPVAGNRSTTPAFSPMTHVPETTGVSPGLRMMVGPVAFNQSTTPTFLLRTKGDYDAYFLKNNGDTTNLRWEDLSEELQNDMYKGDEESFNLVQYTLNTPDSTRVYDKLTDPKTWLWHWVSGLFGATTNVPAQNDAPKLFLPKPT